MLLDTAEAATKAVMAQGHAFTLATGRLSRWPAELCSCLPVSHTFEVGGKGLQRWQPLDGHRQSFSHTGEVCKSYAVDWGWKLAAVQY